MLRSIHTCVCVCMCAAIFHLACIVVVKICKFYLRAACASIHSSLTLPNTNPYIHTSLDINVLGILLCTYNANGKWHMRIWFDVKMRFVFQTLHSNAHIHAYIHATTSFGQGCKSVQYSFKCLLRSKAESTHHTLV